MAEGDNLERIAFEDVSFSYDTTDRVLEEISFSVIDTMTEIMCYRIAVSRSVRFSVSSQ